MRIIGRRITLVAYITGDQGLCCPNRYVAFEFTVFDGKLEQTGLIDLPEPAANAADATNSAVEDDPSPATESGVPALTWSALGNATYPVARWRDAVWNLVNLIDGSFRSQDPNQ